MTFFLMTANTRLHVTSQRHDVTLTLIAIQCGSLYTNCRFLKIGLVDYIGVLQTSSPRGFLEVFYFQCVSHRSVFFVLRHRSSLQIKEHEPVRNIGALTA